MDKTNMELPPWSKNPSIELPSGTGTKTVDISGMDPGRNRYGYEWGCQIIMFRALRWLRAHPDGHPQATKPKNVVGVTINENSAVESMTKYALDHPKVREYGATGGTVEFSIAHTLIRHRVGDDAYFREFEEEGRKDRIFWFDDSEAFPEDCNDGKCKA